MRTQGCPAVAQIYKKLSKGGAMGCQSASGTGSDEMQDWQEQRREIF